MSRTAIDCVGGNAALVRASLPLPDVMFWYGTGSLSIQWTDAEKALFPTGIMVEIDQGGAGTPIPTAQVRDVENGAWSAGQAVNRNGWTADRPTLYGSRSTFSQCVSGGWQGDFWLAWPGWTGEPLPTAPGVTIIGVQDVWDASWDLTTLIDPTWPHVTTPPPPPYPFSVTVTERTADAAFGNPPGTDHFVIFYQAAATAPKVVIARHDDPVPGVLVHAKNLQVPGARGGTLTVDAIVHGAAVTVGTRQLP